MNIKNILIAFALFSSINLFCMDEKRDQEIDIDAEFLDLTKAEFQNILNDRDCFRFIDRNIALFHAVRSGYASIVKELMEKTENINLNIRGNKGRTALMYAIANNHTDIMKLLINGGADLNIQDNNGYTALMWAVVRGNIKMAELLIKACPNLNIQNKSQSTALMLAAQFSQHKNFKNISENIIKIIILLIRAGANINLRDNANKTFLDYIPEKASCKIRLVEEIQKQIDFSTLLRPAFVDLVQKEIRKGNVNIIDKNGKSALIWAILSNQEDIVKLLIDNKANLDIQDNEHRTALHYALKEERYIDNVILSKKIYIVKLLIDNKANLNIQDYKGYTPLMYAVSCDYIEIVELLINAGADLNLRNHSGWTALMLATVLGNIRIAKLLIEKKANLNIQDNNGDTALIIAAKLPFHPDPKFNRREKNGSEIAELLIQNGADTTIKDSVGRTYADIVLLTTKRKKEEEIQKQQIDFSNLLRPAFVDLVHKEIRKGNVNIIDKNDKSALMWAIESNQEDIVKLLIDNKANLDIQDNHGDTALHYALKKEHYIDDVILSKKIYIVKLLIDHGANLNLQDYEGYTPLMLAAFYDNIEIVELLINAGADLNLRNHSGWTALMLATVSGNIRIAKLLIEKKANLNIQDNNGNTALIIAAKLPFHPDPKFNSKEKNGSEIAKLLLQNGADTTIKDSFGRTYSYYVSLKERKKIIKHRLKEHKLPYKTIIDYLF